jgi:hypothetical protein
MNKSNCRFWKKLTFDYYREFNLEEIDRIGMSQKRQLASLIAYGRRLKATY